MKKLKKIEVSSLGTNKFSMIELFLFLRWFADKKPHTILEQQVLHYTKYKKNIPELLHYCMVDAKLVQAHDDDFFSLPFHHRKVIITDKGDKYYRELAIYFGGDSSYYKYYDRDPYNEKYSSDIREKVKYVDASAAMKKAGFKKEAKIEGYTIN